MNIFESLNCWRKGLTDAHPVVLAWCKFKSILGAPLHHFVKDGKTLCGRTPSIFRARIDQKDISQTCATCFAIWKDSQ